MAKASIFLVRGFVCVLLWFLSNLAYSALWKWLYDHYDIQEPYAVSLLIQYGPPLIPPALFLIVLWFMHYRATPREARAVILSKDTGDELIPMREAATRAYEALRSTPWAEFADLPGAPGDTPEGRRILYMANALKVPLYGKKLPSRQYDEIKETDRPLIDNGQTFSYLSGDNEYMDIAVRSGDLKTAIERMQAV